MVCKKCTHKSTHPSQLQPFQEECAKGLKDIYYKHIRAASQELQEQNPGMTKKEALKLAREQCWPQLNNLILPNTFLLIIACLGICWLCNRHALSSYVTISVNPTAPISIQVELF